MPWRTISGEAFQPPCATVNRDGRLSVLATRFTGEIFHSPQAGVNQPVFPELFPLAGRGQVFGSVAALPNVDRKIEAFVAGRHLRLEHDTLWHRWQNDPDVTGPTGWSDWSDKGRALAGPPEAAANADGRIEVFAVHEDGDLLHIYQRFFAFGGAPWSGWERLPRGSFGGRFLAERPTAHRDAAGRLHVVARADDTSIWINFQTSPNGGWAGWQQHGGPGGGRPFLARNGDGRLELFVKGAGNDRIWHRWQLTANGSWADWQPLNESSSFQPSVGEDVFVTNGPGGFLHLFVTDSEANVIHINQVSQFPFWTNYRRISSVRREQGLFEFYSHPTAAMNADGSMEVFALWGWRTGSDVRTGFVRHTRLE